MLRKYSIVSEIPFEIGLPWKCSFIFEKKIQTSI